MKKVFRNFVALFIVAIMCAFTGSACMGTSVGPEVDTSRTQIYVSAYEGGNGVEWLKDFAAEWEETSPYAKDYQIMVNGNKTGQADIVSTIKSQAQTATTPSIYISGQANYSELIYLGLLENLEDVLDMKVDGENGGTIGDKMGTDDAFLKEWKETASDNGEGMYLLPQADNFGLMVFDYEYFLENDFLLYADADDEEVKTALTAQGIETEKMGKRLVLKNYTGGYKYFNYEEGDFILTCGKDGIYGSYDDGQPQTEAEFANMLQMIKDSANKSKPFIWTSQYSDYVDLVTNAAMVQYLGIEEANTFFDFDGPITIDGKVENINIDTGYKVYGNDGLKVAYKFLDNYFNKPENYYSQIYQSDISHTTAQSYFLYAHKQKAEGKEYANILVDGEWFENEAAATFASMENEGRGMGDREYRILFLPYLEGQKGIDGNGNGSVVSVMNNGSIFVPKQSDAEKLKAIKDFIGFMLKDSSLQHYTTTCGAMLAYDYELTDEQYEQLTPFGQICYQIHKDTENVYLSRYAHKNLSSPLGIASDSFSKAHFPSSINNGASVPSIIRGLYEAKNMEGTTGKAAWELVYEGSKNFYSPAKWAEIVEAARNEGFYPAEN